MPETDLHQEEQVDHSLVMMDEMAAKVTLVCRDMLRITLFRELPHDLQVKVVGLGAFAAIAQVALDMATSPDAGKSWLFDTLDAAICVAELSRHHHGKPFEYMRTSEQWPLHPNNSRRGKVN